MADAVEDEPVAYENSPSVEDLQQQIQNEEVGLKLKSLAFRDTGDRKYTLAEYEVIDVSPLPPLLRLVLDPNDSAKPGTNEVAVCTGTAAIGGRSKKVAAFRPKA